MVEGTSTYRRSSRKIRRQEMEPAIKQDRLYGKPDGVIPAVTYVIMKRSNQRILYFLVAWRKLNIKGESQLSSTT